ncbi:MAG: hypothetical protein JSR97_06660 [Verrucomicrobia bacterium]|nr:hypothetical protein [Verrucomicrobiota bacterium]
MNTSKTVTLTIVGIVAIVIMLLVIQLLLRKLKTKSEQEGRLKNSYGVWFATLFIAATITMGRTITILGEAIDNIYKNISTNITSEVAKTASLFIGLSAFWFIVWYFVANLLSVTILGNRKDQNEIETDNVSYFLIKGILIIGFMFCLLPVFEIILRTFMPNVQIPFYH